MSVATQAQAGGSLIFYGGKNYADGQNGHISVAHGGTGEIAVSNTDWSWQSVAVSAMRAFVFSQVNPADASLSYLSHTESVISASIPDLPALYPTVQFPLNYLGLDPAVATVVWVDIDSGQAKPNALAATSVVGGSSASITTLSLPGNAGALGIVGLTQGSAVIANCQYGDYDSATGVVAWNGAGTLVMEYLNGAVTLISATGFPESWSFGAPVMQADGSWRVALNGGVPVNTDIISSLTADKTVIKDDGQDTAALTATVTDSSSGLPVAGVTVNWSATLGNLSAAASVTDSNGHAVAALTATAEGSATVTARLANGSSQSLAITVTDDTAASLTLYSQVNWQGNSSALAEHSSTLLRSALSTWNWASARVNGIRLFSHAAFVNADDFDFRTYRDNYSVEDVADFTALYPTLLTAPLVQGVALGEEDVVVRVALLPSDPAQAVAAVATQFWPSPSLTASVSCDSLTMSGVLAVISKSASLSTIPLKVGVMDPDTGLVEWQVTTSLLAQWDAVNNAPVLALNPSTTPEGWRLWPAQPTGRDGEYSTVLSGDIFAPAMIRGDRQMKSCATDICSLVALSPVSLKPIEALWQYEGEDQVTTATHFTDTRPEKALTVRSGIGYRAVTLRPLNIAANQSTLNGTLDQGAWAALADDGSVLAWGDADCGGSVPSSIVSRTDLVSLTGNEFAFAALTSGGGVLAWGSANNGGNVPEDISLRTDLVSMAGSAKAFAALTASGGAVAWGNIDNGGSVPTDIALRSDLVSVVGNMKSFAALTASGSVVAWGDKDNGGSVPDNIASRTDLVSLTGNMYAFAALTAGGGLVAWGHNSYGGNVPDDIASRTDLVGIAGTFEAFAALTAGGKVMAWGNSGNDGGLVPDDIASRTDLVSVAASRSSFAALTASGGVVGWGDHTYGGNVPDDIASRTDLVSLTGNSNAFAALTAAGRVVAWGAGGDGGKIPDNVAGLLTDVVAIYGGTGSFTALKADKTVVVWGYAPAGKMANVPDRLQGNISYLE